jgi:hypothetical protein
MTVVFNIAQAYVLHHCSLLQIPPAIVSKYPDHFPIPGAFCSPKTATHIAMYHKMRSVFTHFFILSDHYLTASSYLVFTDTILLFL